MQFEWPYFFSLFSLSDFWKACITVVELSTLAWFIAASIFSLGLGILMVNLLAPGVGVGLPLPAIDAASGVASKAFNLKEFIGHIFPKSIIEAMATNEVLQIVIFSLFAGVALIQALVPAMIKREFHHRVPVAMGVYSASLMAGGGLAAGFWMRVSWSSGLPMPGNTPSQSQAPRPKTSRAGNR